MTSRPGLDLRDAANVRIAIVWRGSQAFILYLIV